MPTTPTTRFPLKSALTIATTTLALAAIHLAAPKLPGLPSGLDLRTLPTVASLPLLHHQPTSNPAANSPIPNVPNVAQSPTNNGQRTTDNALPPTDTALLIDPTNSLTPFYGALAAIDQQKSTATILHFGDSPTTADLITGDVRQQLQLRFGDAGPGFNLIAKPWAWYQHFNIDESDHNWKWTTAVGVMKPGPYGIGGVAFDGPTGANTHFKLAGPPPNALELIYQTQPGTLTLTPNDQPPATIDTSSSATSAKPLSPLCSSFSAPTSNLTFTCIPLPPDTKTIDLRVTAGPVRFYGISFLRDSPGILYDSIGLNGASITTLSRALNQDMLTQSFAHLHPALIIINYGTNEAGFAAFINKQYESELRTAIARVHQAAPSASILLMSPMDRGERTDGDAIRTMPTIPQIVAIQQRVAADTGCAFFNTYQAMGGENTMQRWYEGRPRLVGGDLIHPTPQGAKIVATAFTTELLAGYARYQLHPQPPPNNVQQPPTPQ